MHIEVSDKYFAIIEGDIAISIHKVKNGYILMDSDTLSTLITVHQMHVLADWLKEQVEGRLVE